jgi:hypothetical protein
VRLIGAVCLASAAILGTGIPARADRPNDTVDAEANVAGNALIPPLAVTVPPPPQCWWVNVAARGGDLEWAVDSIASADGGAHAGDAIAFVQDGALQITVLASGATFVRQVRECDDPDDPRVGDFRWQPTAPPDPGVYLPALNERVSRLVPLPDPNISPAPDVLINVGLWIAVDNADDVVARAEPAAGIWAETRATLTRTEFDPGNGDPVVVCDGAGSPIPAGMDDDPRPGPCGYTYTRYSDLGTRTAIVRTTWEVTNRTSTGHFEQRAPIVRETTVALYVFEIQTVGAG